MRRRSRQCLASAAVQESIVDKSREFFVPRAAKLNFLRRTTILRVGGFSLDRFWNRWGGAVPHCWLAIGREIARGALAAFLLALLPCAALGSCGDWLSGHAAAVDDASPRRQPGGRHSWDAASLPCACQGPECHSTPVPAPAAPVRSASSAEREIAFLAVMLRGLSAVPRGFDRPDDEPVPPTAEPNVPERPPCPAADSRLTS